MIKVRGDYDLCSPEDLSRRSFVNYLGAERFGVTSHLYVVLLTLLMFNGIPIFYWVFSEYLKRRFVLQTFNFRLTRVFIDN